MTPNEYRAKLEAAEAELTRLADVGVDDRAAARVDTKTLAQVHKHTDSRLARYTEQYRRVENLRALLRSAEMREAENNRTRLSVNDVKGARLVRDRFGWHKVVRVSAKSVTVETAYSWTDRIALDKILQVAS